MVVRVVCVCAYVVQLRIGSVHIGVYGRERNIHCVRMCRHILQSDFVADHRRASICRKTIGCYSVNMVNVCAMMDMYV